MNTEDIYEKMKRWNDEKKANDEYFWQVAYPKMDEASKLVYWRKDVFNALQAYGKDNIPTDWLAARLEKDADFESIMKKIIVILSS
jgi:hypothetical protein